MNHFKIIVPFYNVEKWIKKCIKSIKLQSYSDYECILVDDMSTDNSADIAKQLISDDNRFRLVVNKEKKYALKNIYDAITSSGTNPQDIIVTLDGDDWLATKKALEILNDVYIENSCFLTYGSYIEYPTMSKGAFCRQIPASIVASNAYRESRWLSSHLRTFKRHLWDSIEVGDLKKEEKFFRMTWDMAFMFPMLEMAGPLAMHIEQMLYCYNRENPLNDDKVNHKLQLDTERMIRNKEKYTQDFIIANLLGPSGDMSGIGNQLFGVATALAHSYDNNAITVFPQLKTEPHIKKYRQNLYSNLNVGRADILATKHYNEPSFDFKKIDHHPGFFKIKGYFQSYRYFQSHRDKILDTLNIKKLQKEVCKKYGDYSDYISIHVRRGDYLNLSQYHYNLQMDYYKQAIDLFDKESKFLIFSNDIEWCKSNFNFLKSVKFSKVEEDWQDILLMSTCKHNIIANSSFSWWGAWFNTNTNKTVIAPKNWFGPLYSSKNTKDLIPPEWNIIQ